MDIQCRNLTKQYGSNAIIKDYNATFFESRINCLMGASGIGKTTLVHIIMGLIEPESGEVAGRQGKRIAAVFQEDRLIDHWNAVKNVRLVCEKSISADRNKQELKKVGLEDDLEIPVKNFSGGMRRRVAIVRAILAKSDLIILHEPFRGLDEELKLRTIDYIKENTKGKTVIVVTHEKKDVQLLEANLVTISVNQREG
jgi:NitT/TauT family transport system ATP-binding protein